MKRREFITAMGGVAAWPLVARSQDANRKYRLGVLSVNAREAPQIIAAIEELRRLGFIEGQNLTVEFRRFADRGDASAKMAAELIKTNVDAIWCNGLDAARSVQALTRVIPILTISDDMVGAGFVQSLARPGGNITGISILAPELDGKRQDILLEMVPDARRIAVLADANATPSRQLQGLETSARARNIELSIHAISRPDEISAAIGRAKAAGAVALNVLAASLFSFQRKVIIERTTALRLPAIYQWPEMAEEGGLAAYGPRLLQLYRQLARQMAKALRGMPPGDIPVEQPTQFELVLNLRAAKAIGHEIPAGLVLRADKLIE